MHAHKPFLLGLWMSLNVVVSLLYTCLYASRMPWSVYLYFSVCVFSPTGVFIGMCALEPAYECLPRVGVCLCESVFARRVR